MKYRSLRRRIVCLVSALASVWACSGLPAGSPQIGQAASPTPPHAASAATPAEPAKLAFHPQPRPWGETFLPRSQPPARRLLVVDATRCSEDERRALVCLQGLTSRSQPRIWLVCSHGTDDEFWLDYFVKKGYLDGCDTVADWRTLFRRFSAAYRGAVAPDDKLYRGDLLAANVAACEDLIVASPELAAALGIPVKIDLRGRFRSYADGLDFVWKTYRAKFNRHLCDITHRVNQGSAFPIQWRSVMFWPCGPVDSAKPGADMRREKRLVAEIMSQLEPNIGMLGFPAVGKGVGVGEVSGVDLASRYGIALVCSDSLGNDCVTSGMPVAKFKQPVQASPPRLERDKIYIALALSDGDNQQTWRHGFRRHFEHPRFGEFPLAFGIGPAILDLQPAVAQWYYEHAGPRTEFLADVSGIGYIAPDVYGANYKDPQAVFDGFLDWTNKYQALLDLKTVRPHKGADSVLARYASRISGMHSVFADMGRYTRREGIGNLTCTLPDGTPVFHAVTSWRYGKDGFLREVREQVGQSRPAFVNGFVHCWTYRSMDDIARIYDERDKDMVFVTPSQLAALYRQARKEGWSK